MRTLRVALTGFLTSALLVGCGGDPAPPSADATSSSPSSRPDSSHSSDAGEPSEPSRAPATSGAPAGAAPGDGQSAPAKNRVGADEQSGSEGGTETPLAPEASETTMADLIAEPNPAPLVTAPLPRAASALGRLVSRFPGLLRPPGRGTVESSSLSPSGDRMQVGLVVSTSRSPAAVLMAYRTRLARRGMTERMTPGTSPGSQAAAFGRGRSSVTITVTEQGMRTEYAVYASLQAGGG